MYKNSAEWWVDLLANKFLPTTFTAKKKKKKQELIILYVKQVAKMVVAVGIKEEKLGTPPPKIIPCTTIYYVRICEIYYQE